MHRRVDVARRSDDHALQPVGILAGKIRHVPVERPDHVDLDRRIFVTDEAGPGGRDQEMRVGALIVHVADPALGRVVLDPRAWLLAAHPVGVAAAMGLARRRLAEDALIGDLAEAVDMPAGRAAGIAGPDRHAVGRQVGEPGAEPRVDVFFEDLGRRLDMRVGVIYAQPILHNAPSHNPLLSSLYTRARDAGTPRTPGENARPHALDRVTNPAYGHGLSEDGKHDAAGDLYRQ